MAPKPFPFPIGIGVDMCLVNRVAAILRYEHARNRWARKIFTRLEWPALCRTFQRVENAIGEPVGQPDAASDQKLDNEDQATPGYYDDAIWMLPRLSGYSSTFDDEKLYWSAIANKRSTLGALAHHLAGRSDFLCGPGFWDYLFTDNALHQQVGLKRSRDQSPSSSSALHAEYLNR